jgi:hypothetical protein
MKTQIDITEFQQLIGSKRELRSLLEAIQKLTTLDDSEDLRKEVRGYRPLGSWSGWSW